MRLVIVSHTEHYRRGDELLGWGATIREIDHLATLFDEVIHVAPIHDREAPASALPYQASNVTLRAVPPAGGGGLAAKLRILSVYPRYWSVIRREFAEADAVHIRCPANISLLAVYALRFGGAPRRRWIKYAGNWQPYPGEPRSYRLQREWLQGTKHGAQVTVNGRWPDQPPHVHSFLNPCLTDDEVARGREVAATKSLDDGIRLLFVGRLETPKGAGRVLEIVRRLLDQGLKVDADMVGDGPERSAFEAQASRTGIADRVTFHGWMARTGLSPLFERAHFMVLPSASEGWPKVLSEAMAYGVVAVASNVGCIGQFLDEFRTGAAIDGLKVDRYADRIIELTREPRRWNEQSRASVEAAERFSYGKHVRRVGALFEMNA